MQPKAPKSADENTFNEYDNFAFHPHNVLLILLLFGLSVLFLSTTIAFIYTRVQSNLPPIQLPSIFYFNTLILITSSGTMIWAKRAYLADKTDHYQLALAVTIVLSIFFMFMQYQGWRTLVSNNIFIDTDNSAGYLYLISSMHFGHVIAGIPFIAYFLWVARKRMKEPVSVLVYFSDPEKRLRLRLLTIYWHFLDILWIYLVLFFLINWLIR